MDNEEATTSRKETWSFRYKPAVVLAAAKKKAAYHASRRRWWESTCAKAERRLKKKGVDYREREVTLETRIEIVGDPELAHRVTECRRKVREHLGQERQYATWARALSGRARNQPKEDLDLGIEDIEFFGL